MHDVADGKTHRQEKLVRAFRNVRGGMGAASRTIGTLIGHKGRSVTSRCVHSADAVLLAAVHRVAGEKGRRTHLTATQGAEIVTLHAAVASVAHRVR